MKTTYLFRIFWDDGGDFEILEGADIYSAIKEAYRLNSDFALRKMMRHIIRWERLAKILGSEE